MRTATRHADDLDTLRVALVGLTAPQTLAAHALAAGSTHGDAAEAAGVTRETVTRWSGSHPGFRAALDRYRLFLVAEQLAATRRIRGKALAVIERALDADDAPVALAVAILRAVPAPEPTPALDADQYLDADVRRLAAKVPGPPAPRTPDGCIDLLQMNLDNLTGRSAAQAADRFKVTERIATEQLAYDAGVLDDVTAE